MYVVWLFFFLSSVLKTIGRSIEKRCWSSVRTLFNCATISTDHSQRHYHFPIVRPTNHYSNYLNQIWECDCYFSINENSYWTNMFDTTFFDMNACFFYLFFFFILVWNAQRNVMKLNIIEINIFCCVALILLFINFSFNFGIGFFFFFGYNSS